MISEPEVAPAQEELEIYGYDETLETDSFTKDYYLPSSLIKRTTDAILGLEEEPENKVSEHSLDFMDQRSSTY